MWKILYGCVSPTNSNHTPIYVESIINYDCPCCQLVIKVQFLFKASSMLFLERSQLSKKCVSEAALKRTCLVNSILYNLAAET
jgi:hypothetical protein